jgi:hypothetical protein
MKNLLTIHSLRRYSLLICIALGAGTGLAFAYGTRAAFNVMFGTFLWSLIAGSVASILVALSGHVPNGDWRTGLRISAKIYFANSTGYLIALLVCAALGPAQEIAGTLFTLPTMARIVAPAIYFAASVISLSSIFYYRRVPERHGQRGGNTRDRR